MKKAIFGLAESEAQAVSIFNQLLGAGFSDHDISVLFPDETGTRHFAHEQHTKAPEGAAAGAGAGGATGALTAHPSPVKVSAETVLEFRLTKGIPMGS